MSFGGGGWLGVAVNPSLCIRQSHPDTIFAREGGGILELLCLCSVLSSSLSSVLAVLVSVLAVLVSAESLLPETRSVADFFSKTAGSRSD